MSFQIDQDGAVLLSFAKGKVVTYSVHRLEEALPWFQREADRVSCPSEQVWSKKLAQEIVRELRNQS